MVVVRRFLRWAVAVMCGCYAFACAAEPVVIEATVEPAEPYIQQQVTYIVRAYVDTRIEFAELAVPLPQGAVTMPLGEDEDKILTRDGVDPRRVFVRRFALFPQTSGEVTLPAPRVTGTLVETQKLPGLDLYKTGNTRRVETPVNVRGPARRLRVRAALASTDGATSYWLPAQSVAVETRWHPEPWHPEIGVPATQVITLRVTGLADVQLPHIAAPIVPGVNVYPARVTQYNRIKSGFVVGTRIYQFTYVPRSTTSFAVPEISVPWWDLQRGEATDVVIPALTVALPESGTKVEDTSLPTFSAPSENQPRDWTTLAVASVLVCVLAAAMQRYTRLGRLALTWYRVRVALSNRRYREARDHLLAFAALNHGARPLTLGAAAPADAKTLFDALEAELYGPPATVGSVPISAWSLVMAVRQAGKQPATVTALPKLYQER